MIEKSVIPADEAIVLVKDYIEDIAVELKYSTCDNFTGKVIYDYKNAYLRYGTIKRLKKVQNALKEKGYRPVLLIGRNGNLFPMTASLKKNSRSLRGIPAPKD